MNKNAEGPGYYDVASYVAEIKERWLHPTAFEITPPIRRGDDFVSGWTVRAYTWRNEGSVTRIVHAASASFGRGGGHKTMPSAMYNCLLRIWDKYEDAAAADAALAAF